MLLYVLNVVYITLRNLIKVVLLGFKSVYFSQNISISFQTSTYQVVFLNLKNLFSYCLSIFLCFHKLQLCLYKGKFWYIYIVGIKINKNASRLFHSPAYYISLNFPSPCLLRPLPSSLFIWDLRVFSNEYFSAWYWSVLHTQV